MREEIHNRKGAKRKGRSQIGSVVKFLRVNGKKWVKIEYLIPGKRTDFNNVIFSAKKMFTNMN
jgi:hypothetical protein